MYNKTVISIFSHGRVKLQPIRVLKTKTQTCYLIFLGKQEYGDLHGTKTCHVFKKASLLIR